MRLRISIGLFALAALSASTATHAAPRYGRAGCGLGSVIMGPTGSQTSAYTSNASTFNQAFGITSGTSNCQVDKEKGAQLEQEKFIVANLASISKEMAQGSGDTLVAFAEVLGCSPQAFPAFSAELKTSYRDIFTAPGALAVLDASKEHLKSNPVLSKQCSGLS